jgi:hypothetical protein
MTQAQLDERNYSIPFDSNLEVASTIPLNSEVIFNSSLNEILGYSKGFRSSTTLNDPPLEFTEIISSTAPNINVNSVVYLSCQSIENPFSSPTSNIFAFSPISEIGSIISIREYSFVYQKIQSGYYNKLVFRLVGRNNQALIIKDPEMSIILNLKKIGEI